MSVLRRLKRNLKKSIMRQLSEERLRRQKDIVTVAKDIQVKPQKLYIAELTGKAEWNLMVKLLRYYKKKIVAVLTDIEDC